MKRRIILIFFSSGLIFTACANPKMLKEYSELNLLKSSDVLNMVDLDRNIGFASDLAVVSVIDNTATLDTDLNSGETATAETTEETDETTVPDESGETDETTEGDNASGQSDNTLNIKKSALLVNLSSNEALYYKDIFAALSPASLTKVYTALMVLKYGNMEDVITLPESISVNNEGAQVCGFEPGDVVSVKDLFHCMLVYSGNETANALAVYISESIPQFCNLLNDEARKMGAVRTSCMNPGGLDESGHFSSSYDLYLIFKACLEYDEFVKAIGETAYSVTYTNANGESVTKSFDSTNLYFTEEFKAPSAITIRGGKTGTTDKAGTCLIVYCTDSSGTKYIAVVMGEETKLELYSQMNNLLSMIQKN